jgi:hypothetical protein
VRVVLEHDAFSRHDSWLSVMDRQKYDPQKTGSGSHLRVADSRRRGLFYVAALALFVTVLILVYSVKFVGKLALCRELLLALQFYRCVLLYFGPALPTDGKRDVTNLLSLKDDDDDDSVLRDASVLL